MPKWLTDGLEAKSGLLHIAGSSTVELANRFDTPLNVVDAGAFRRRIRSFKAAAGQGARISYASKANSAIAILGIALSEGLYVDTASEGELEAALRAGFTPQLIHLHGSNKSDRELELAASLAVGCVIVDNFEEIERLAGFVGSGRQAIMLRLAPGVDPDTHKAIRTGQEDSKFGLNIADGSAERALMETLRFPQLRLIGFHCHVGSQLLDSEAHVVGVQRMAAFACAHAPLLPDLLEVNVGGGLGARYVAEDSPPTFEEHCGVVLGALTAVFDDAGMDAPRIGHEPGRCLIAEAGTTLYRAGVIKLVGERSYLSVDGGMADNPRPQLYGAKYTAYNASRIDEPHQKEFRIVGRHCESDTLIDAAMLPENTQVGDVIAFLSTGAYQHSMSSNYNRYPKSATVLLEEGRASIAIERESLDSMFERETHPSSFQAQLG